MKNIICRCRRRPWIAALALASTLLAEPAIDAQTPVPRPGPPPPRFPAQLRPPDDPALVERGRRVYGVSCRSCHGADLRGGDMGGPNLLRSPVALNDLKGELLEPIIKGGRGSMPAVGLPLDDVMAVAAYIHSVQAAGRAQGAPPAGETVPLDILVGNATAGQAYFAAHCTTCHSPTGDLRGVASRVTDPMELQNLWVGGGRDIAARTIADPPGPRDSIATVTPASGAPITGRLHRLDDFIVTLVLADGTQRTFRRTGNVPKVDVQDPLSVHRAMLQRYTDSDIHDVTAFLATLR